MSRAIPGMSPSRSTRRLSGSVGGSRLYVRRSGTTRRPYSFFGMATAQAASRRKSVRLNALRISPTLPRMEFDIFFSICQTDVHGYMPNERVMFENFFEQVELADRLGFGTAWVAESHLSTEVQEMNPGAVIPHFVGEIGLNTDILQLAHRIFGRTKRIGVRSAIMNILCNGGPIPGAQRLPPFP